MKPRQLEFVAEGVAEGDGFHVGVVEAVDQHYRAFTI
jgi:hypothetical protein